MLNKAKEILLKVFGYEKFYPMQENVINAVLNKKDALVIMPTGGGKSICYQIPALVFEGLTVVISPLISLMKDQVDNLTGLGVPACLLSSAVSKEDYEKNKNDIRDGRIKLLYAAPESAMKPYFTSFLKEVNPVMFAIDEAHCISHWGHDFRPEYRQLSALKKIFPAAVIMALTATATGRVREDIKKNLKFGKADEFIAGFDRPNIFLEIKHKKDPFGQTAAFLKKFRDQSGIIYCFSRKQTDELYEKLLKLGLSVKPYHAGLSDKERKNNQELFIRDDIQIIIATIAFGMGINKPNVRFVIHYDLPRNIESYYQEIGRAGRDGLPAHCLLLYSFNDTRKIQYFIDEKENPEHQAAAYKHLKDMITYSESKLCRRFLLMRYFGENYNRSGCGHCDNCLSVKNAGQKNDATVHARLFLEAVQAAGQRFGAVHVINILRGGRDKKIIQYNHDGLSVYAKGADLSKDQWLDIVRELLSGNVIIKDLDEYGIIKFAKKAFEVLSGALKIYTAMPDEPENETGQTEKNDDIVKIGIKPKAGRKKETREGRSVTEYNEDLFNMLRKKRKEIADRLNLPPYIIFPDTTLIAMASLMPDTMEEISRIHGVGSAKLEKYGEIFLLEIRSFLKHKAL